MTRTSVTPPVALTSIDVNLFISLIPSVSLNNVDPWKISVATNNLLLIGTYTVKLMATLVDYALPTVTPASMTFDLTILHPCTITKITAPVIPDLEFIIGDPPTSFEFDQMQDSVASDLLIPKYCG